MSIERESGIEFDFTLAASYEKHDTKNRCWPGVDFEIQEMGSGLWIWLEIKNWEPSTLPPRLRGPKRWSFLCKMKSNVFFNEMRGKFLGTSAFLALTVTHPAPPERVLYVLLVESPALSTPMKTNAMTQMRNRIPLHIARRRPWPIPVTVAVMDVGEWNARFPQYPARIL